MFRKSVTFASIVVVGMAVSGWVLLAGQEGAKAPTVTRTVLNQQDLAGPATPRRSFVCNFRSGHGRVGISTPERSSRRWPKAR